MRWLINWCRTYAAKRCPKHRGEQCSTVERDEAAAARVAAERKLAEAKEQGPEVSAIAGRLRRVRGDDFAALMTEAMRGAR